MKRSIHPQRRQSFQIYQINRNYSNSQSKDIYCVTTKNQMHHRCWLTSCQEQSKGITLQTTKIQTKYQRKIPKTSELGLRQTVDIICFSLGSRRPFPQQHRNLDSVSSTMFHYSMGNHHNTFQCIGLRLLVLVIILQA